MCSPFNMVPMLPAISLPVCRSDGELSVGLQVGGRRHGDEALLALARLIERAEAAPGGYAAPGGSEMSARP